MGLMFKGRIDMDKFKIGFTLAEVLITLGIIGVVSAMTLPTLIANKTNREMEAIDTGKITLEVEISKIS